MYKVARSSNDLGRNKRARRSDSRRARSAPYVIPGDVRLSRIERGILALDGAIRRLAAGAER